MSVAAGSLTINAAFLREIKDDNRELRQMMKQLNESFESWSHAPPEARALKKADDMLSALRDQLALHFSLEESFGYFENAVEAAPRLSDAACSLRAEHAAMFRHVGELVEKAERLLYHEQTSTGFDRLLAAWRSFAAEFERHEERECELIVAAFDDDLGVGD